MHGQILAKAKQVEGWRFECDSMTGQYGPMSVFKNAGYGVYRYHEDGITINWHGHDVYKHTPTGVVKFHPDACWIEHLNKMIAVKAEQAQYRS